MFTPAKFKELLLPLLSDVRRLLVKLPTKSSLEVDFAVELWDAIAECGLEPRSYEQQLRKLNVARGACVSDPATPASDMFHYFIELEHLSRRFSMTFVKGFSFVW